MHARFDTRLIESNIMKAEEESEQLLLEFQNAFTEESAPKQPLHPAIAAGIGGFMILNVGLLLSLPPVLMGRGAPYLPTVSKKMDKMFAPLKSHQFAATKQKKLVFVDLGSGDGRVVFRAAREGIFHKSFGYEINPRKCIISVSSGSCRTRDGSHLSHILERKIIVLHLFAQSRRFVQAPSYLSSTNFFMKDLWKVDLREVDVVAVYGLNPIMKNLGIKMQEELQPGSVVLSNVFSIPGWKASSTLSRDGMHIYVVPDCWKTI